MTEPQRVNGTPQSVLATISLIPLHEEEDDFETLGTIETVRTELWKTVSSFNAYTLQMECGQTRDAGVILLLAEIVRDVIAQKNLVVALFQAGMDAISSLAKQGQVKKIEMTLDGDSITIENADQLTVQRLIGIYEAKHPGKTVTLSPSTTVHIVGTVSKVELLAPPDSSS